MSSRVVLCLPGEDEIETTVEKRISESTELIQKTIRYKSGIRIKLILDFTGKIFRFSMNCAKDNLRISNHNVLRGRN